MKHYPKTPTYLATIMAIVIIAIASRESQGQIDNNMIQNLDARLKALQSIGIEYSMNTVYTPKPLANGKTTAQIGPNEVLVLDAGTRKENREFWLLNDQSRYESHVSEKTKADGMHDEFVGLQEEIQTFSNDRSEDLVRSVGLKGYAGTIRAWSQLPAFSPIEAALGLRGYGEEGRIKLADLQAMQITNADDTHVTLVRVREGVGTESLTFRKDLGYSLESYSVSAHPGEPATYEVINQEFESVGNVNVPKRIVQRLYAADGGAMTKTMESILTVNAYHVNDPTNTTARYRIKWPGGTPVGDYRSGIQSRIGTGTSLR